MPTDRSDVYTRVTDQIIAELEKGVRPWLKPWSAEHAAGRITRPLRAGGEPYKGINVLMLWMSAQAQGFAAPIWMTFNQAKGLGAGVKKGAKGSLVVYANHVTRAETADDGEESERDVYFMKGYTVFNVEQVEGLPAHFHNIFEGDLLRPHDFGEGLDATDVSIDRVLGMALVDEVLPEPTQVASQRRVSNVSGFLTSLACTCVNCSLLPYGWLMSRTSPSGSRARISRYYAERPLRDAPVSKVGHVWCGIIRTSA